MFYLHDYLKEWWQVFAEQNLANGFFVSFVCFVVVFLSVLSVGTCFGCGVSCSRCFVVYKEFPSRILFLEAIGIMLLDYNDYGNNEDIG